MNKMFYNNTSSTLLQLITKLGLFPVTNTHNLHFAMTVSIHVKETAETFLATNKTGICTVKTEIIPIGRVQAPVALRSSIKVDMIGKSFCLLSSLEMKPLSSCNARKQKDLRSSLRCLTAKSNTNSQAIRHDKEIRENALFSTSRVVRYPDSFLTIGSRAHVLVWASQTRPRLNRRALRLYFLCSMHTGHPINFLPMAVLK